MYRTMSGLIDSGHINKKVKKNEGAILPSSLLVKFLSNDGTRLGPPIDIPTTSTSKQLEQLINSLLENDEQNPYAFYVKDYEVTDSLHDTLLEIIEANKQLQLDSGYAVFFCMFGHYPKEHFLSSSPYRKSL